jgi:hypothetical protein
MSETGHAPFNQDLGATHRSGRLAHLLESFAIVLLAALAAYAASA